MFTRSVTRRRALVTSYYACLVVCLVVREVHGLHGTTPPPNGNPCPTSSRYYFPDNTCLMLLEEMTTWMDARSKCSQMKTDMVYVHNKAKNDWIYDTLKLSDGSLPAWIGLYIGATERKWVNGVLLNVTSFKSWADDVTGLSQGCVFYSSTSYWGIEGCTAAQYRPLCELQDADKCLFNNGGCDHFCVHDNSPDRYSCRCEMGYSLQENGRCEDIDECIEDVGQHCEQGCNNTVGGWICRCNDGYKSEGVYCLKAEDGRGAMKIFALVLLIITIAVVPMTIAVHTIVSTVKSIRRTISVRKSSQSQQFSFRTSHNALETEHEGSEGGKTATTESYDDLWEDPPRQSTSV